jgi:hypothetical protein
MSHPRIQYWKDRLTRWGQTCFSGPQRRLKSGMQSLLLQLEAKGRLPSELDAVELFGMHGLWHTMDYVERVRHLEFFEIDKYYLELARKSLAGWPVTFHHADSIAWLHERRRTYNFIVADIPHSGPFYADGGLPIFLDDLLHACAPGGVIVFNCHTAHLLRHGELERVIRDRLGPRVLSDIFYVPRNSLITYVVMCLDQNPAKDPGTTAP